MSEKQNELLSTFKEFFGSWANDILEVTPEDGSSIVIKLTFGKKRFGMTSSGSYFMETL